MKMNSGVSRRRAMMEDIGANPRQARKLYEEEDEEIEVEADVQEFDGDDTDIESQTISLIKAMKADGMLTNVSITDEEEDGEEDSDDDGEDLDESVRAKNRALRIAEAKARIARRRMMENRKRTAANPAPSRRISNSKVPAKPVSKAESTARRIAEAKARIVRRRMMENRKRALAARRNKSVR